MQEKVFKTVTVSGVMNLVLGITVLAAGLIWGVLLVVSGAKLLHSKKDVMI